MRCEKCQAELSASDTVCQKCGTPVSRNVEGFENTIKIKSQLKRIVDENGKEVLANPDRCIALLNDYIPEYDKERRLLKNMLSSKVLSNMLKEGNEKIAIMKAQKYMTDEVFLSSAAAEFVIVCFTYMLGWQYESKMEVKEEPKVVQVNNEQEKKEKEKKRVESSLIDINANVFKPSNAIKYRGPFASSTVIIPDGFTKIEGFCFDGARRIATVQLPETMVAIGEYAFSECRNLKSIDLPASLRVIKTGAFSQCAKLTMIKIPEGVLEIEEKTFQFCRSLEIVEIPSTVSSIGTEAFAGCDTLRKVFIPDTVKFIDVNAFSYCPNLVVRCYENSYVHKYCIANSLNVDTIQKTTFKRI